MKLRKIELKPVNESQSGCRAVIRSSGCSISPCKEEALSPSPLQPVALLTHGSQDSNTPIPVPSSVVASLLPCDLQLHPLVECIQLQGRKKPPCCIAAHRHVSLRPRAIQQRAMVPCCSLAACLLPWSQSQASQVLLGGKISWTKHFPGTSTLQDVAVAALAVLQPFHAQAAAAATLPTSRARLTRAELFPAAGNQPQCLLPAAFITEKSLPAA